MRSLPLRLIDRWLAPAPDEARVGWLSRWTYAHRGLHGAGLPENSLGAAQAAINAGLGIECDIQRSLDDQPMVFHDWDLDRLTGVSGLVEERTAQQLGQLPYRNSEEYPATLSQFLDLVRGRSPLLIEIKSKRGYDVEWSCLSVRRLLETYDGPHAVMSFDPRVGRWFARNSPQTVRGLVMTQENDRGLAGVLRRHLWLWIARPDFLAYDIRDLPSPFASAQQDRGIPLLSWTVRSEALRNKASQYADAPIAEGEGIGSE